jgi:nucleotide-binding universal stress UspA family protein
MARYRKILVAYDGSDQARNALEQAIRLADEEKSWIKVVAVVPSYQGELEMVGIGNIKETMEGPGRKLLDEAKTFANAKGVHILTNLEQGEPYERIVHVADDENCDLIIMGRKGANRLERALMGSVTARVIGHTNKDVLVVPDQRAILWDRLLVATDGSLFGDMAVDDACRIAQTRGVPLTAVTVVYTNDEVSALAPKMVNDLIGQAKKLLEDVRQRAEAMGVQLTPVVMEGEPHEAILAAAANLPATLIILGSHGKQGMTRLLMGSVTERVIGLSNCPVLISHLSS